MEFQPALKLQGLPENYFQQLDKKVNQLIAEGRSIINLGKGNPDGKTPDFIVEALTNASQDPQNHGYAPFDGKPSALQAVADFYHEKYQVQVDPETEILIFQGAVVGIMGLVQALLNPGDRLVTPSPFYPSYEVAATLAQAEFQTIATQEKSGFLPDLKMISEEQWDKTDLLILNYPNNPTGAVATSSFFQEIVQQAHRSNFPILHDFAYGGIGYEHQPLSILETPGAKEVAVEVYTASKTYNMAGWRFGFAVGNASLIKALKLYHAQAHSTVFGAIQDAASQALLSDQSTVAAQVLVYQKRKELLVTGLRSLGWEVHEPKGAIFCWVKVPDGRSSASFADYLLTETGVVVVPGHYFGEAGEGYIRISLLESEDKISKAIERLSKLK